MFYVGKRPLYRIYKGTHHGSLPFIIMYLLKYKQTQIKVYTTLNVVAFLRLVKIAISTSNKCSNLLQIVSNNS